MLRAYLAHPAYARHVIREWELAVEDCGEVDLINPFYDNDRSDIHEIDAGERDRYDLEYRELVDEDLRLVRASDFVLACFTNYERKIIKGKLEASYGTPMEAAIAAKAYEMPVHIIATHDIGHPWLKDFATKIWDNFFEASLALGCPKGVDLREKNDYMVRYSKVYEKHIEGEVKEILYGNGSQEPNRPNEAV
jgi:hypothetical protein